MKKKILFLTLHRKNRSPGQRFRHEQYLKYLEEKGFEISYSNMLNAKQDKVFYGDGNSLEKILIGISSIWLRLKDVFRANQFDYIFIFRDAFFFGIFFERLFKRSKAKLIFDFDDSIWIRDDNLNPSFFQRLKNPVKTGKIISYCDLTIAGNKYLATYAANHTQNIQIIPTTIDLMGYSRMKVARNNKICIGWSGSFSTIKHFETVLNPLKKLKEKYKEQIYFKIIGDGAYRNDELNIQGLSWKIETEIPDLCEMDIGIMPLPDDEWSRGKCGLKSLQYMALEIPTIISPVGVNSDIVEDGTNGFLASSPREWVEKLSILIENESLRKKMGKLGRKTVEESYSVEVNKEKWLKAFGV